MEESKMTPTTLAYKKRIYPGNLLNDFFCNNYPGVKSAKTYDKPKTNIVETEKFYAIQIASPGMVKSDFKISLEGNLLLVQGQKEKDNDQKAFLHREFRFGTFTRKFELPEDADESNISASYKDGILAVEIAKTKESTTVNREVKIN